MRFCDTHFLILLRFRPFSIRVGPVEVPAVVVVVVMAAVAVVGGGVDRVNCPFIVIKSEFHFKRLINLFGIGKS